MRARHNATNNKIKHLQRTQAHWSAPDTTSPCQKTCQIGGVRPSVDHRAPQGTPLVRGAATPAAARTPPGPPGLPSIRGVPTARAEPVFNPTPAPRVGRAGCWRGVPSPRAPTHTPDAVHDGRLGDLFEHRALGQEREHDFTSTTLHRDPFGCRAHDSLVVASAFGASGPSPQWSGHGRHLSMQSVVMNMDGEVSNVNVAPSCTCAHACHRRASC